MSNWYKISNNMEEYGRLNKRIKFFQDIIFNLNEMKDHVSKNPPRVKRYLEEVFSQKELSSFPEIKNDIQFAIKKVLDNYKETGNIMDKIAEKMYIYVSKLIKERKSIPGKLMSKIRKNNED